MLGWFDWSVIGKDDVIVDLRSCGSANYQAMSLLVLYVWWLRLHNERVDLAYDDDPSERSATTVWQRMGARGWSQALYRPSDQFRGAPTKPLFAIRGREDAAHIGARVGAYLESFSHDYIEALRHMVSELIYNAVEHGTSSLNPRVPAIAQVAWYRSRATLSFLVADLGVGVKKHLEGAAGPFATDLEAIRKAVEPNVSGTFGTQDPYAAQNNAGLGLFVSSGLARALGADLYLVSGGGLLHVSDNDTTGKTLSARWPGTFVLLNVKVSPGGAPFTFAEEKARILANARKANGPSDPDVRAFVMSNHFGRYGEDKDEAIRFRDRHLLPAIHEGKTVKLDFRDMNEVRHSFAHALLAGAVKTLGVEAYRRIKILNGTPDIRSTLDFVFENNLD